MGSVQVEAMRWVDAEGFLRVLEVRLTDAGGDAHQLIDKESVFSADSIGVPGPLDLDCSVDGVDGESVTITLAHSVMTDAGRATFTVAQGLVTFDS